MPSPPNPPPSVGRIVHYCPVTKLYEPHAAIVVKVRESGSVRLRVFSPDESADLDEVVDAEFSETPRMGCWSWPPRVG